MSLYPDLWITSTSKHTIFTNNTHTPHSTPPTFPPNPSGQYLLRVDVVVAALANSTYNNQYAQLYPSCAQISVRHNGSAIALSEGVRFPEVMSPDSPGLQMNADMAGMRSVDDDYVHPGGRIWDGEEMVVDRPDLGV